MRAVTRTAASAAGNTRHSDFMTQHVSCMKLSDNGHRGSVMAIPQIKGIDDALYARLRQRAAADHRSTSQEVLHLLQGYLTREESEPVAATSARALLALAGSWDDERSAEQTSADIRAARRNASAKASPWMYLLDTDTVIDAFKGRPDVLRRPASHADDPVGVSAITLMELYYGAFKSKQVAGNLAKVRSLEKA
jgi:plasmid stability protein